MAIAITLAWLHLLNYLKQLPWLGVYVLMFWEILGTFLQFGIIFVVFIMAFGLGFHLLLINQTPFQEFKHSLLKTSIMMIGELEADDIFHGDFGVQFPTLTGFFFACFVLIMPIIIMNLLVGLAVDDIQVTQITSFNTFQIVKKLKVV